MIDPQFIINLKGKSYPVFAGILDAATKAGLTSLVTRIVQIPDEANGNTAIVMARAEFADGRTFEDVGDCSPRNVSPQIATAALRMASTRAKGRALRDAINCGMTMLEEMPDERSETGGNGYHRQEERPSNPPTRLAPQEAAEGTQRACADCGCDMTPGQVSVSVKYYGMALCLTDQKKHPRLEEAR